MTLVNIQGQNIDATKSNKVGNKQNNKIRNNLCMTVSVDCNLLHE